jgi:hypothetical protein
MKADTLHRESHRAAGLGQRRPWKLSSCGWQGLWVDTEGAESQLIPSLRFCVLVCPMGRFAAGMLGVGCQPFVRVWAGCWDPPGPMCDLGWYHGSLSYPRLEGSREGGPGVQENEDCVTWSP